MNLEKVFEFIKERRGYDYPFRYKLVKGLPLTEDELNIEGHLDLEYSKIMKLPDNLTVNGRLDLQNTNIEELPNNLTVNGYLDIEGTDINEFPNNLKIGGNLYLIRTPFGEKYTMPEIIKMIEDKGGKVGGDVFLSYLA